MATKYDCGVKRTRSSHNAMMQRCFNAKRKSFPDYGGRGISVCERWKDFKNFVEDMGIRPHGTCLERINNDGNYTKENCKWATASEQNINKRDNVKILIKGQTKTLSEWCEFYQINIGTVRYRKHKKNLDWEAAFESSFDEVRKLAGSGYRHIYKKRGRYVVIVLKKWIGAFKSLDRAILERDNFYAKKR